MRVTFSGRSALVTGGGSGLGRAVAMKLAGEGVDVWVCGRTEDSLAETVSLADPDGGAISSVVCDVTDPAAVAMMYETIGHVPAILVNNAAGAFVAFAENISPNGFRAVVDVSLNGAYHVISEWGRRHIAAGSPGVAVNVTSATVDGGSPGTVHSGAAKSGLVSITKTLAIEWARYGLRINAIAPGAFATEGAEANIWSRAETEDRILRSVPLGRLASVDEIALPTLFLVSEAASYATGAVWKVDGGWTLNGWLYESPDDADDAR
jgi:NAD(P)-dependent dehydrogenase (short-subunit alcohol dehydrogenase family)